MARIEFTKGNIETLPLPTGANRIDYAENDVRGFAIQTTKAGRKTFLLVYVAKESGRERRMVLGEYGPAPRLTVAAARRLAAEKRALVDLGRDPWLEAKELRAQNEAEASRRSATFATLMAAYVTHLEDSGKASAKEVEAAFERNITKPFPKLAKLPADAVTVDDVMPALRRLTRAGKWRAAEKLAIYFRAAYNVAKGARIDAGAAAFDGLDIRTNPLAELRVSRPKEPDAPSYEDGVREQAQLRPALSEAELRAYWEAIAALDSPHGAMMRFHLLTGGQRMEQLSRLTLRDLDLPAEDFDGRTVMLRDPKGRRKKPRLHQVPLIPDAVQALEGMRGDDPQGPHLFTVSQGAAAAVPHTLAAAVRSVSGQLIKAGKITTPITPGTIRRTVETRLAAARVSKEIRAQLQSHGLGGLQDRHYDRHHYLPEKLDALKKLRSLLKPKGETVIKFPVRAGGGAA